MKHSVFFTFFYSLLSIVFAFGQKQSLFSDDGKIIIENDTIIIWNEKRKIEWSDFYGKQIINKKASAESGIGIAMKPYYDKNKKIYRYLVFAYFDKRKSSFLLRNDYLLEHERMHFNIGEIYAREIRKEIINQLENNTKEINYQKIFYSYYQQYIRFQESYDKETAFSRSVNNQKKWDRKVLDKLNTLEPFSVNNYMKILQNKKVKEKN